VLGVAYKPNVADTRDSPALEIIDVLRRKGAEAAYHDFFVPALRVGGVDLASVAWPVPDLAGYDAVLVLAAHAGYDWKAIARDVRLIVDTRNATDGCDGAGTIVRL